MHNTWDASSFNFSRSFNSSFEFCLLSSELSSYVHPRRLRGQREKRGGLFYLAPHTQRGHGRSKPLNAQRDRFAVGLLHTNCDACWILRKSSSLILNINNLLISQKYTGTRKLFHVHTDTVGNWKGQQYICWGERPSCSTLRVSSTEL